MSLVGSLEDLGLGEILQIVSLSGKSGVLVLRSAEGEGRVFFRDGLLHGAVVKDGPTDLRALLAQAEAVSEPELARLDAQAQDDGTPLEALVIEQTGIDAERIDEIRGEYTESTVYRMFRWRAGEFSFEIRQDASGPSYDDLLLRAGLNAQFLALEGTRILDETRAGVGDEDLGGEDAADEDPVGEDAAAQGLVGEDAGAQNLAGEDAGDPDLAGEEAADPDLAGEDAGAQDPVGEDAAEVPVELEITVLELLDEEVAADVETLLPLDVERDASVDEEPTLAGVEGESTAESAPTPGLERLVTGGMPAPAPAASEPVGVASPRPVRPAAASDAWNERTPTIAIDPELATVEWIKHSVEPVASRVHIFQRSEQGISRIRQYVMRGEAPLVVLTTETPPDPVSGADGWSEIAARLRAQVPNIAIVLLASPRASILPTNERAIPDAVAEKPDLTVLADERARERRDALSAGLREAIERTRSRQSPEARAARASAAVEPDALGGLKLVSAQLRDPGSRGEILRLVMTFTAERFDRVAMFMVRDGEASGMGQICLGAAGGPDDDALREVSIPVDGPGWFRKVMETRAPVCGEPRDEGDHALGAHLGSSVASRAYVAPIESGERVAALLYADNLPSGRPIVDTSALEVVLHEAGLALANAVLERAVEEAEAAD